MDEELQEIIDLIRSLEQRNLEVIGIIAEELNGFRREEFTGQATFVLNYKDGLCGDVELYTREDESEVRKAG